MFQIGSEVHALILSQSAATHTLHSSAHNLYEQRIFINFQEVQQLFFLVFELRSSANFNHLVTYFVECKIQSKTCHVCHSYILKVIAQLPLKYSGHPLPYGHSLDSCPKHLLLVSEYDQFVFGRHEFDGKTNQLALALIDMSEVEMYKARDRGVSDGTDIGLRSFLDHCSSSKLHQLTHIGRIFLVQSLIMR